MVLEVRAAAEDFAVEGPGVLGVGRGMHADVAAARAQVAFECGLLGRVQHVAGGVEENHRPVQRQARRR